MDINKQDKQRKILDIAPKNFFSRVYVAYLSIIIFCSIIVIFVLNYPHTKNTVAIIPFAVLIIIGLMALEAYYNRCYVYQIYNKDNDIYIKYLNFNTTKIAITPARNFKIEKARYKKGSYIFKIYIAENKFIYQTFEGEWNEDLYSKLLKETTD